MDREHGEDERRSERRELPPGVRRTEEFHVSGEELLGKVKSLLHEGNIRRIAFKNEAGRVILEIPLTVGVAGAVLAPVLVAVGAMAAVVSKLTIAVERVEE